MIYGLASRHHSLEFKGIVNLVMTLEWLEAMKEVMAMLIMTNQEKVKYVAYLLRWDAKAW